MQKNIHDNEPVVEIGSGIYLYNEDKKKRKVHLLNPVKNKSYCQTENGSNAYLKRSLELPANRKLCEICDGIRNHGKAPPKRKKSKKAGKGGVGKNNFYKSYEWAQIRYKAFKKYGRECVVCGTSRNLTIDHIKPYKKCPELALDLDNLQVMCRLCNRGKSGWDETDWR